MAASNTGDNSKRKGRFVKGDPRINRKGRPKSFDALRELAQQIAHEAATTQSGDKLVFSGHVATVAEAILRQWATSKNNQLQKAFIEVAFGKVPDEVIFNWRELARREGVDPDAVINELVRQFTAAMAGSRCGRGVANSDTTE